MSIRNLSDPNTNITISNLDSNTITAMDIDADIINTTEIKAISIDTSEIDAGNIYSIENPVLISSPDTEFSIETVNPTALFIRVGDYVVCNGKVDIKMNNGISPLGRIKLELKILEFDEPFNIITNAKLIGGGCLNTLDESANASICQIETGASVSFVYNSRVDNNFTANSEWFISYTFSYKLSIL
jgi:hypothetical protein